MRFKKALVYFSYALTTVATLGSGAVAAQERFRIALDTNPSHVRNQGIEIFAEELKQRVGDTLDISIYPSGQMYRDRDVPTALRQNAIEMAVPGTWQLDGLVPNIALQTMPMFYGVDMDTVHTIMGGRLGDVLNKNIEERLRVKILGEWFDLGFSHYYTTGKKIETFDDLKGLKIRFPGGTANAERMNFQGVVPTLIPYSDLPMAMSQGVVEGVTTSHESAATGMLYDSGLRYGFEDYHFMAQYVPMIRQSFWNKQPEDVQNAILESWAIAVGKQREMAKVAQDNAKVHLAENGVEIVTPAPEVLVDMRKELMSIQPDIIKAMKIDQDVVDIALEELRKKDVEL